ncbi:hypothetical protein [Chryseobacterium gossypii]|uniref:hypothetical protein n=1 Tax=Chryseobacterium gossypii TaxID=3231602 RepID=UPI0035265C1A
MRKTHLLQFLLILILNFTNAQTITFISEKNNRPLPKVSVFGKDGDILAYSDIDGKIDKRLLPPSQEKFQLVYDNFPVASLSYSDLDKDVIKIDDKIKDIEAVVIKNNKPAKYVFIKGAFNSYVTVNGRLNCYVDGVVTYIFDNETKKLKSSNIDQYRVYRLVDPQEKRKLTATWDYDSFLETPKLKNVGNIEEYKKKKNTKFTELKGDRKDEIEVTGEYLQQKELALFGFRLFDLKGVVNISYEKDSEKTLRDLLEYNEILFAKLKHKTEPDYNQIIVYNNFYPKELDFSNDSHIERVKLNTDYSNYKTPYWKDPSFPNMQNIFSSFFKDDLKEQQNKK